MRSPFANPNEVAREIGDTTAAEKSSSEKSDTSVGSDENWFSQACRALLEHKPGTALHYVTGFDERSCQRYAAGSVKPPAYFFRALLRSEQGWTWLAAAMDGSSASWWLDIQRARDCSFAYEQRRELWNEKSTSPNAAIGSK